MLEPSPDRIEPVADHPGAPWQVLPYERQLAVKQEQVDDALTRIGRLEGYELAPIVPALEQWRYRNKLEYSFGEGPDGELVCGFHAPGRFDQILPLTDCVLASERSNAAREQVAGRAAPAGPRRLGPPHAAGLPAQPRRARGPPHRPAAGPPGHLARQARRRRADRGGRRRGAAVDPDRGARREHPGRRDRAALRRAAAARAARRPALPDLAGGVLPDQHGDGRGALRPRRRGRRACAAASASSTSTAGSARSASRSPRGRARSSGSSSSRPPCPTRSRTRSSTRSPTPPSSPATSAWRCASSSSSAGKPDVAVIDPPRAGLSQKVVRRIIEASPQRIVYVSCNPTTLAPNAAQLVEAGWVLKRRAARRHVPPDPAHRVRRTAGEAVSLTRVSRFGFVNAFLVEEEDGLTLVDTAIRAAARRRSSPRPPSSAARSCGSRSPTPTATTSARSTRSPRRCPGVEVVDLRRATRACSPRTRRPTPASRPRPSCAAPTRAPGRSPTRTLAPGDRVGSLEVVAAPGHTPGHVAFLDTRDRTLIAGDAFSTIGGVATTAKLNPLFPFPVIATWHKPTALETARTLRALDPSRLAVGHGPIVDAPGAAMDEAIAKAAPRASDAASAIVRCGAAGRRGGSARSRSATARKAWALTPMPQCEALISTCSSASGSRHERHCTMPSLREYTAT